MADINWKSAETKSVGFQESLTFFLKGCCNIESIANCFLFKERGTPLTQSEFISLIGKLINEKDVVTSSGEVLDSSKISDIMNSLGLTSKQHMELHRIKDLSQVYENLNDYVVLELKSISGSHFINASIKDGVIKVIRDGYKNSKALQLKRFLSLRVYS